MVPGLKCTWHQTLKGKGHEAVNGYNAQITIDN